MGVQALQGLGLEAKGEALRRLMKERGLESSQVVHVGNDVNDLPVFELVGWAVAVADAYPEVLRAADFVLSKPGGSGAVRELCDLILRSMQEKNNGS
jgi:N-acylneuraminate cytidylyltransferase